LSRLCGASFPNADPALDVKHRRDATNAERNPNPGKESQTVYIHADRVLERERVLVKKQHGTFSGSWMIWLTKRNSQPAIHRFIQSDTEIVELNQEVLDVLRQ
jgi:hypothetical protein